VLILKTVTGLRRDDCHFTAVVPFRWLLDNIISGLVLEDAQRDLEDGKSVDKRAAELAPMRAKMQRPFQKLTHEKRSIGGRSTLVAKRVPTPKLKNTSGDLRDYMVRQFAVSPEEAFGVLPGFVAVWPERMDETPISVDVPGMELPWTSFDFGDCGRGALADGECRHLAAMYINADPKVPAALKDKLMNKLVTVEVYHGITSEAAAQMFVDLNFEGTPVDRITKANIDPRNRWITATKRIFNDLEIGLATSGRQLTASHQELGQWILLTHAEQMVKAVVLGPYKALAKSKQTESWDGVDFDRLHKACVAWFGEIFDHFRGPAVLADQSRVIRTIAVRIALASLGSAFYHDDPVGMNHARDTLKQVNWVVTESWNGIGGKVTMTEGGVAKMSAGSGKESITKAVQAVTKPDTKAGMAVRGDL
jgi:hypothetical protein